MKEITHEQVKQELQEVISEYGMDYYTQNHFPITRQFLKQQEIKGWLLNLYRDRFSFYNFDEDSDLRKIKALEEELK